MYSRFVYKLYAKRCSRCFSSPRLFFAPPNLPHFPYPPRYFCCNHDAAAVFQYFYWTVFSSRSILLCFFLYLSIWGDSGAPSPLSAHPNVLFYVQTRRPCNSTKFYPEFVHLCCFGTITYRLPTLFT